MITFLVAINGQFAGNERQNFCKGCPKKTVSAFGMTPDCVNRNSSKGCEEEPPHFTKVKRGCSNL